MSHLCESNKLNRKRKWSYTKIKNKKKTQNKKGHHYNKINNKQRRFHAVKNKHPS